MEPATPPKKVFISYTHDSPDHRRRVLELAERLRDDGLDVWLDQYVEHLAGTDWADTDQLIEQAEFVLVVFTARYRDVFDGKTVAGLNKGSKSEASYIHAHIRESDSRNTKFLPVLLEGATADDIPIKFRTWPNYSPTHVGGYLNLYRTITGQPAIVARPVGSLRILHAEPIDLPPLPDHAMAAQSNAYLQRLREETGEIRIGSIDRSTTHASSFPISDVYVPLHFVSKSERPDEQKRHRLESALRHRKLIIQGDAGQGKSTFMRCAAFDLSQPTTRATPLDIPERAFPLYIRVSELDGFITRIWGREAQAPKDSPARETDPAWLAHFLAMLEWGASQMFFESKLRHEKTVLLLDGLDEAPGENSRERMAKLLGEASRRYAQCRIVVTTRPQALVGEARPQGFEEVRIDEFDDADVKLFVERWCACKHDGEPAKAERERTLLNQALAASEISAIAKNPLMLAALTVIHFNGRRLPDNRLDLYEAIVRWLAESRRHRDWETRLERLRMLALGMQTWPGGRVRSLEMGEAATLLSPLLPMKDALRCLRVEEADSGILAARGENVEFPHLTFQEYLAALELAGQDAREIHRIIWEERRLYSPDWREVMRFLAAILRRSGTALANRLFDGVIDRTGAGLAERARTVALLWTLLGDLRRRGNDGSVIGFRVANPRYEQFVREMEGLFVDVEGAAGLDAKTRAEAAEAWESLGDVSRLWLPSSPDYWVDLGEFGIGRYPVTVWEYGKFVEAGGKAPFWDWEEQLLWPQRPVVYVDWQQAVDYCKWSNARLPTSEQWELAAAGSEERKYPWGSEEPDEERANFADRVGRVTPVGLFPKGDTPEGVSDLAGNVWEWTRSDYDKDSKVVRGGAFGDYGGALRSACRVRNRPGYRYGNAGFRCVRE